MGFILTELIEALCPDGVAHKRIGDIAEVGTGSSNGNEAVDNGLYPFFVRSQTIKAKDDYEYDEEAIIIPGEGGIGEIFHYVNGKYALHQRVYRIHFITKDVNVKFAYYYMQANFKSFILKKAVSATVTSIRKPMVEGFPLPIPPLPVQSEIVRILDSFTELTAELTAELKAETIARGKQYEYYREELLKPKANIPMVTLGEIATDIYRGAGIKRDQVTEDGIPCVRYGEIYTTYNTWFDECVSHTQLEYIPSPKYFEHGDILFAITGESVEDIAKSVAYVGHERCLAGGDIVVLKHKQNPRYLAHVLATKAARDQKSKGKVKSKVVHASVPSIEKITIPLPPLDVQARYADVLDNFEAICTDLNIGLPAEIEARKTQYEFFRDQLLTFAETGKTILTDRQTDRQTADYTALIRLCQYVFGYVLLPMGDLFDFRNGLSKGKEFFGTGTPFIRYTDVYNNRFLKAENITALVECTPAELEKLRVSRGDVLFTRTSETAEDVGWSSVMLDNMGDCVFNGFCIKGSPITDYLLPEYCAYCFTSKDFRQYVTSHCAFTTRASLTGKTIAEYLLPVPSIEEQKRIAGILDKFHKICTDLSNGLPAEIAARQKQYEYYRDRLLTF